MKNFLISLGALLFGSTLFSAPVSVETAKKVAENWYYEKGKVENKGISIENYLTEYKGKEVVFYVFNIKPLGYVIVSADDIVPPVLGYSIEGRYNATNHPPQMDEFLDCFKEQIVYAKRNNITPYNYVVREWNRLNVEEYKFVKLGGSKDVAALLTTTWAQNNIYGSTPVIYNSLCPTISSTNCLTGCVATTMGQIMNYHEHPTTGVGSHSYYDDGCAQTLSANFGATTYDWANMPTTLQGGSTTTQRNAVGTLLFHCGVAVEMHYGTSASSATNTAAASAFINYFAYDNGLAFAYKASYADTTWARMMKTELDSSRPIFYWGSGTGGHAFVMDGYSGNYFHFNWGWEGDYNGNFLLTDLTPGSYNFTNNQGALFRIKPSVPTPDISTSPDTLRFTWTPPKKNILSPSNKGMTDTIYYDDGIAEAAVCMSVGGGAAVRFTPEIYPCTLKSIIWYPYLKDTSCEAHVWDDDGGSGVPGTSLTAFTYTPGVNWTWEKKDLASSIVVDAGDFWVGWIQPAGNIFYNGYDTTSPHLGRTYSYAGTWSATTNGDLLIRAIVTSGSYDTTRTLIVSNVGSATLNVSNITGSETWITSISPTSFSVGAHSSQNVTVVVTKDGLGYGYHNASLSITSNDPDENPKIVPVKFYVTPPGIADIAVTEDTIRFVWDDSGKKTISTPSKGVYGSLTCKVSETKKSTPLMVVKNQPEMTFLSLSSKDVLDTLIYDNGTPDKTYYWGAGAGMGARMSPSQACKIMAIQIFCGKAETYKVGIYNWTGSAPGSQLLETGNISSSGQGWNTTDVSASNINVAGDFVASFNMLDADANLGVGNSDNGRAWDFNGSNWTPWNETYFVRAIVSYGGGGGAHDTIQTMTVRNDGGADLHVSNITKDQTWITSVSPTSFTVTPASSQNVTVIVNRTGLGNGTHLGSLTIASDDPDEASYVEPVRFLIMNVGVEENQKIPFSLSQNYPNPARSRANIEYALPEATNVTLKIYDMTGRPIRTLITGTQKAGQHKVSWDGRDDKGNETSNGIYFYRLETTTSTVTKKLTLMK